jgi:hypothetical protein
MISSTDTMNTAAQCSDTDPILAVESIYQDHPDIIFEWAFNLILVKLRTEVATLSQRNHGLHFGARNASAEYLDGPFMQEAAMKMKKVSPWSWKLIQKLLDARQVHENRTAGEGSSNSKSAGNMGENVKSQTKKEKKAERIKSRNTALIAIVCYSLS